MAPFVVLALPRSRTHWLSAFLSYGGWHCGHDEARHCRSLDDVRAWLSQPMVGSVETAASPFWRLLPKLAPDARVVVVRRPVEDVARSLIATGTIAAEPEALMAPLRRYDRKLQQIERRLPGVLSVSFADLEQEATCAQVFEHCLQIPHDHDRWARLAAVNIQEHLSVPLRYFTAHRPQLDRMARIAGHRILQDMRRHESAFDGIEFRNEPFREFHRDADALIREHCAAVGRSPEFNVSLFEALSDIGALQTMTARIQQRVVGYLLSIVGPSLDSPEILHGTHTAFYVSPDMRGLGVRLLMRANDALRERGVHEIIMRAGVVGSGPGLGAVYRRLGAEPFGQLYKLGA